MASVGRKTAGVSEGGWREQRYGGGQDQRAHGMKSGTRLS